MSDALRTTGTTGEDGGELTGTPTLAGGNAAEPTQDELRAEVERLRAAQAQSLAEKETLEATKRENEALRARLSSTPPTGYGAPAGPDPRAEQQRALSARIMQLESAAAAGDPDAQLVVGLWHDRNATRAEVQTLRQLIATPQEDQQRVLEIQQQMASQGEYVTPATAKKLLDLERLSAKSGSVQQRDAELRAVEDARSRGVVATRPIGVPASAIEGKTMTMSQFEARTANMTPAQMRAFDRELESKGIVVALE
jgi:hypothetical protein